MGTPKQFKDRAEYLRYLYKRNIEVSRKKARENARKWRKDNPEKAKESDKVKRERNKVSRKIYSNLYYQTKKSDKDFQEKRNKRTLTYYYRNKEKCLARGKLYKHVRAGKISKPESCEVCLEKKHLEAHHEDYTKPLEVIWICKTCHEQKHHD